MSVGQGKERVSGKTHYIKVVASSPWTAICRVCRQKVVWAKTVTNPRWVRLDWDVLTVQDPVQETMPDDDEIVSYFPAELVHWNRCVEERGVSDGEPTERGGDVGSAGLEAAGGVADA